MDTLVSEVKGGAPKVMGPNHPCRCGSGRKYKQCHQWKDAQARRKQRDQNRPGPILLKTPEQIDGIRRACRLVKRTMDELEPLIKAGVKTADLNQWVHDYTLAHKAIPATLGYRDYPASTCISINEVICHGIPGPRVLKDGDIVNVDVTSILDGYYGDISRMYVIGSASAAARRLVRVTKEALEIGIEKLGPGRRMGDMSAAIQGYARKHGYTVVEAIGGHGVGLDFHEEPFVPHLGEAGTGVLLRPGMVFTVEPMINAGGPDCETLRDKWTVVTTDRSLSAQWEHTVAITKTGVEVLTG